MSKKQKIISTYFLQTWCLKLVGDSKRFKMLIFDLGGHWRSNMEVKLRIQILFLFNLALTNFDLTGHFDFYQTFENCLRAPLLWPNCRPCQFLLLGLNVISNQLHYHICSLFFLENFSMVNITGFRLIFCQTFCSLIF